MEIKLMEITVSIEEESININIKSIDTINHLEDEIRELLINDIKEYISLSLDKLKFTKKYKLLYGMIKNKRHIIYLKDVEDNILEGILDGDKIITNDKIIKLDEVILW